MLAGRAPLPGVALVGIWALLSVGVLAAWGVVYTVVLGSTQEHRAQRVLYASFRGDAAAGTVPTGGKIAHGTPVAVLGIPRLGVRNLVVVEGTTSGDLEAGPGHRRDSPLPGEVGTSFVFGRSTRFGAPFAHITDLVKGDPITVTSGEGTFTFNVDTVRRPGDSLSGFNPDAARLTLVTSEEADSGLTEVVYVDATLKGGSPLPPSKGRPVSIPAAEKQLQGDRGAWLAIVLWLEGLLVTAIALTWARGRWARAPVLLVAVPIVAAMFWGVAQAASQLLPNLI